jgi:hypothetical protein
MGLEKPEAIDVVIKTQDGGGELIIYDSGNISNESERYELLMQKLMNYAEYVASGQYKEQLVGIEQNQIAIRIVCTTPPSESMKQVEAIKNQKEPIIRLPVYIELEKDFRERIERKT